MALIANFVEKIRAAIYGKDVRESIASAIEAINGESEAAAASSKASAKSAAQSADFAATAHEAANAAANNANEKAQLAGTAAANAGEKAQAAEEATTFANTAAGEAQAAKEAANAAAELANSKAADAETAAEQANTAAGAAQEAKTAADTAAAAANTAAETAQSQGNYAKAQGDRAAKLVGQIENTDVGGMATDILALQSGKADLVDGKVPEGQLPEMDFDSAGSAAAVQALLSAHTGNTANPHNVTAEQLGAVPTNRKINGLPLIGDITLTPNVIPGSAKRDCVVVGTSTANGTAENCDYLCDGVNDDVEISAAIEDAYSRGFGIRFLGGVYNLNSSIAFQHDMQVYGTPQTGEKEPGSNFPKTKLSTTGSSISVISAGCCQFSNIRFGNITNVSNNAFFYCDMPLSSAQGSTFFYCAVSNIKNAEYCAFIRCAGGFKASNSHDLLVYASTRAVENIDQRIYLSNVENSVVVACEAASEYGELIGIYRSNNNIVAANKCLRRIGSDLNVEGIKLYESSNNLVIGNAVIGADRAIDKTIYLNGTENNNNLILGNLILGKNYVSDGGTGNTFVNNKYN